jgi:oligopeptide/dipeptide ABC transporter ATP-binding protein
MYAGRVVEMGSALDIFDRPAHPYTRGLLASRPRIAAGSQWLRAIEGTVPGVGQVSKGCSFAPRCPLARAECGVVPELRTVGNGHDVACVVPFAVAHATRAVI